MLMKHMLSGCMNAVCMVFGYIFFIRMYPQRKSENRASFLLFLSFACAAVAMHVWAGEYAFLRLQMLIFYPILHGLIVWLFYRCTYASASVWFSFYCVAVELLKLPLYAGRIMEYRNRGGVIGEKNWIQLEMLWYFLLLLFLSYVQKVWKWRFKNIIRAILKERAGMLAAFTVLGWGVLAAAMYMQQYTATVGSLIVEMIILISLGALFLQMCRYVVRMKEMEQELARQQEVWLREQKAVRDGYVRDAKRLHDMKHVLLYLQKCIAEEDTERAQAYLRTYIEETAKSQKKIWTGFSEIDFSVNYYYQMMREKGIRFCMESDVCEVPFEEVDMMIVLGNLLDNAMTAAERCDSGNRYVRLKMQTVNEMFFLELENSMKKKPRTAGGKFLSSKGQGDYHGWGIETVKEIVVNNGGEITFSYTEDVFKAAIVTYGRELPHEK